MNRKRALLILGSLILTFILLRIWLHTFPNSDLNIGPYNIHHLYTGLLFITFCGIPLTMFHRNNRILNIAAIGFGAGLSMALDEWVYLIVTDGSNMSYLLPVSLWGGIILVLIAVFYIFLLIRFGR